jgi:hypothetical protein
MPKNEQEKPQKRLVAVSTGRSTDASVPLEESKLGRPLVDVLPKLVGPERASLVGRRRLLVSSGPISRMVDPMRTVLADLADVFSASEEETIQVDLSERVAGGARRTSLARRVRRATRQKLEPPPTLLRVRARAVLPRQQLIAPVLGRLCAQLPAPRTHRSSEEHPRP